MANYRTCDLRTLKEIISKSEVFDPRWYQTYYKDVSIIAMDPIDHYLKYGWLMNRCGSNNFNAKEYIKEFPRAKNIGAIIHYETVGRHMGVNTSGYFRDDAYQGPGALNTTAQDKPDITVIVTAYNAQETISDTIASLQNQTHRDIEILVVDDCSTDKTTSIVEGILKHDQRVRLERLHRNYGTYWAKNLGIYLARADIIALSDSDDISMPNRLEVQLDSLRNDPRILACCVNYQRINLEGHVVLNRGAESRLGYMTLMARKELFDVVGFYDSVRIAADDEFHKRMKSLLSPTQFVHIPTALYSAKIRESSLTGIDKVKLDVSNNPESDGNTFLSPTRQEYVKCYSEWHQSGEDLRMSFPLRKRPFPAPSISVECYPKGTIITASVASFPPRVEGLSKGSRRK